MKNFFYFEFCDVYERLVSLRVLVLSLYTGVHGARDEEYLLYFFDGIKSSVVVFNNCRVEVLTAPSVYNFTDNERSEKFPIGERSCFFVVVCNVMNLESLPETAR